MKAFLTVSLQDMTACDVQNQDIQSGDREEVRILVIGSAHGVERVIQELFAKRFAEVREWSDPIPTGRFREIMRILTRFILVE